MNFCGFEFFGTHPVAIRLALAEVMVLHAVHHRLLVITVGRAKSLILSGASLFIKLDLVLKTAHLIIVVGVVCLVLHVLSGEVRSVPVTNRDLPVHSRMLAAIVQRQGRASIVGSYLLEIG